MAKVQVQVPAPIRAVPSARLAILHRRWLVACLVAFVLGLIAASWGVLPRFRANLGEVREQRAALADLAEQRSQLQRELSVAQRRAQVSEEANRRLQSELEGGQQELSRVRADLSFYERLVGGGARQEGLSAYSLELRAAGVDGVYRYVLTLAQNLRQGRVISGRIRFTIEGVRNGRMERIDAARFQSGEAAGDEFSFKYFQRVEGDWLLPADFQPVRVRVRLQPASGAVVDAEFGWDEALGGLTNPEDSADVGSEES